MSKTVVENHRLYEGHPDLPDGKSFIEILYYPTSHAYKESGEKLIGVSGVGDIIDKAGLRAFYMNEAIAYLTRALIPNNDGVFRGMTMDEWKLICQASKTAHKVRSDRGKETGTKTHEWAEKFLIAKRDGLVTPEPPKLLTVPKVEKGMSWEQLAEIEVMLEHNSVAEALSQFIHYYDKHEIEVVAIEQLVFELGYRYAGRFDAILRIDGKLYLVDFKTNNPTFEFPDGVYPEQFLQIGGYDIAYTHEFFPVLHSQNKSAFDGHAVFNFSKKTGKFSKRFNEGDDVLINRKGFVHALGLKRAMQHKTRQMSLKYKENRKDNNAK